MFLWLATVFKPYIVCYNIYTLLYLQIAGQQFGLLEIKAIIATLIYNFYIEPVDYFEDIEVIMELMLRPTHQMHVRFVPIDVTTLITN